MVGNDTRSMAGHSSEGHNPRSACGVEQTHESFAAYVLSGGCENLWTGRGRAGILLVTSGDDGAEREETWEGVGPQPMKACAEP